MSIWDKQAKHTQWTAQTLNLQDKLKAIIFFLLLKRKKTTLTLPGTGPHLLLITRAQWPCQCSLLAARCRVHLSESPTEFGLLLKIKLSWKGNHQIFLPWAGIDLNDTLVISGLHLCEDHKLINENGAERAWISNSEQPQEDTTCGWGDVGSRVTGQMPSSEGSVFWNNADICLQVF